MRLSLFSLSLLLTALLRIGSAQISIKKFDFLSVSSDKIWGIHLRGRPTESYNEWNAQAPSCTGLYNDYLAARGKGGHIVGDYIYNVTECILESSSILQTQTLQASSVLLGLAPILLSMTGPTLTELALISVQRPVLAVLLSLATAAVYPTRTFSFYDDLPREVIQRRGPSTRLLSSWMRPSVTELRRKRLAGICIGGLQYILATAAVFNVFYTSWTLGTGTISTLACTTSWQPLMWVSLPLVVHAIVCGAFHRDLMAHKREGGWLSTRSKASPLPKSGQNAVAKDDRKRTRFELHILPSYAQDEVPAALLNSPSVWVDLAHKLGTMLAFAQVIAGVIILSSLLFIAAADAAMILLRYLLSAIVSRVLIAVELSNMRVEMPDKPQGDRFKWLQLVMSIVYLERIDLKFDKTSVQFVHIFVQ